MIRITVFAAFLLMTAGAAYVSWYGVGAADRDAQTSVRSGSAGNLAAARIK